MISCATQMTQQEKRGADEVRNACTIVESFFVKLNLEQFFLCSYFPISTLGTDKGRI